MRLSVLQAFSRLAIFLLGTVGVVIPLGLVQMPLQGLAPVLFYFSLILLMLTLTLSRLGIFFAGLARDRAGQTLDTPRYVSGITDKFIWPSAILLLGGCFLFMASFIVQAA